MRQLVLVLVTLAVGAPSAAQVKITTSPEGRIVLSNRTDGRRTGTAPEQGRSIRSGQRSEIDELIARHAIDRGLDPLLIQALIQVESGYDARAVSPKGALGLMQLMPETAAELAVGDPFDPNANVRGGTAYLRQMLDTFDHQLPLALAGYNAGPAAVRRFGGVPPYQETQQYVRRVLRLYRGEGFDEMIATTVAKDRRTFLIRRDGRLVMTNTPTDRR